MWFYLQGAVTLLKCWGQSVRSMYDLILLYIREQQQNLCFWNQLIIFLPQVFLSWAFKVSDLSRKTPFNVRRIFRSWSHLRLSRWRIQFSSPVRFFGGPGMLRRTSLASEDFLMMTSFSRSAVCIRRTLNWLLRENRAKEKEHNMQSCVKATQIKSIVWY